MSPKKTLSLYHQKNVPKKKKSVQQSKKWFNRPPSTLHKTSKYHLRCPPQVSLELLCSDAEGKAEALSCDMAIAGLEINDQIQTRDGSPAEAI